MVKKMDEVNFGFCSNTYGCEFDCPKGISVEHIARMNREFFQPRFANKNMLQTEKKVHL
jgi:succinate dehydrogenase / fumarate reductase, iron-sulfur subunit